MKKFNLSYIDFDDVMLLLKQVGDDPNIFTIKPYKFKSIVIDCPIYANTEKEANVKVASKLNGDIFINMFITGTLQEWLQSGKVNPHEETKARLVHTEESESKRLLLYKSADAIIFTKARKHSKKI